MATNRYEQLKGIGQILEVPMDRADFLLPGRITAIGTRDLNGCSGVAILGQAIILAHIAPLPPHPEGASPARQIKETKVTCTSTASWTNSIHFTKGIEIIFLMPQLQGGFLAGFADKSRYLKNPKLHSKELVVWDCP